MLVGPAGEIDRGEIHPQEALIPAERAVGVLEDRCGHHGMNVVSEGKDRVFRIPGERDAVLARGEAEFEQALVRLLRLGGILGLALVGARVDAALRALANDAPCAPS